MARNERQRAGQPNPIQSNPIQFTMKPKIPLILAFSVAVGMLAVGCRDPHPAGYGSRLHMELLGGDSPEEIVGRIRTNLAKIYAPDDVAWRQKAYQVTNGPARWVFVQVFDAPRGIGMFNLHCYELVKRDTWLLHAYVPVFDHFYTNGVDRELTFRLDPDYLQAVYRGEVVFTAASRR